MWNNSVCSPGFLIMDSQKGRTKIIGLKKIAVNTTIPFSQYVVKSNTFTHFQLREHEAVGRFTQSNILA